MAQFPNDSELHHVSGVEVPDDTKHYAVKDGYARELADILNREKSEVYIVKPGVKPSQDDHHMACYFSSKEFRFDKNVGIDGKGSIELASVEIAVNIPEHTSITNTYTVDVTNTDWDNLDYDNMNTHIAPIRVCFYLPITTGEAPNTQIVGRTVSYIIMSYTHVTHNPDINTEAFYSGTGVIYTRDAIDDFMCVLVRMKLQETNGKKQAVITVTELPKDLSSGGGGSVNAVATNLDDGTANLSFS